MAISSPQMGLKIWNLLTDDYDHAELADNWAKVDQHDHTSGKGVQIPTGGIADGAITAPKIDPSALPTLTLADGSVVTSKIVDGAVTTSKIGTGQVTSGTIADGTIQSGDIGPAQITTSLLANNSVDTTKLESDASIDGNRAVNTNHMRDGSVTTNKLSSSLAGYVGVNTTSAVHRGYLSIPANQTTTSTTFTTLSTADQISNVIVPTNGVLIVYYSALWKLVGATNDATATIFIGANPVVNWAANGAPIAAQAILSATGDNYGIFTTGGSYSTVASGFNSIPSPTSDSTAVTTGTVARPLVIDVAPGTYTVSVQYHVNPTAGGTLNVQGRTLRVYTEGF